MLAGLILFPSTHPRHQGELGCASLAPVPGLAVVAASLGRGPVGAGGDGPGTPVNGAEDVTSLPSRSQGSHGRRRRVSASFLPLFRLSCDISAAQGPISRERAGKHGSHGAGCWRPENRVLGRWELLGKDAKQQSRGGGLP